MLPHDFKIRREILFFYRKTTCLNQISAVNTFLYLEIYVIPMEFLEKKL